MTAIVDPPDPIIPPVFPALGSSNFNNEAYAWGTSEPAVVERVGDMADATHNNAIAAHERAQAAAGSAVAAAQSAADADADAQRLAALDALWLGAAASDPTTGRDGVPLVAGNAYVNTGTGILRAYNGTTWVQGVSGVSGVTSLNGHNGALVWGTLADYGIGDAVAHTVDAGNANLNTLLTSGFYEFATATNGPPGVTSSQLVVSRGGATALQIVVDKSAGTLYTRGVSGIGGTPTFSAWRRQASHSEPPVTATGGVMNCALGNRFTLTVSSNTTLSFSNVPSDAYACVIEINHTAGTLTLPGNAVWANNGAGTFNTGKRHLLYFEKATLGTAGWYVSALGNFNT